MLFRRWTKGLLAAAAASLMSACVVAPPVIRGQVRLAPPPVPVPVTVSVEQPPAAVVSVYVDPPLVQPEPIAVEFAPPPMLVQMPPPQPFADAVWIGGYWGWQGRWVWCSGRWAPAPQPGYVWTHPYYENRDGVVVYVAGFWRAPTVAFVPPPPVRLRLEVTLGGVTGVRPIGPPGVFVPPPPGSRLGIVVPAPVGTAPAVVMSAPPVVNVGMRVQANTSVDSHDVTHINQTTVNNVRNVTNVTNVTIVAPPGATASGKAYQGTAPALAHLAAAQPSSVHVAAPRPSAVQATPGIAQPTPARVQATSAPLAAARAETLHAEQERAEQERAEQQRAEHKRAEQKHATTPQGPHAQKPHEIDKRADKAKPEQPKEGQERPPGETR